MYKYIILIPVILLLRKDFQVFQMEGKQFFIQLGILSTCWLLLSIFSFVIEIPLLLSINILVRAIIYSVIFLVSLFQYKSLIIE